jgi:hypothetical protein
MTMVFYRREFWAYGGEGNKIVTSGSSAILQFQWPASRLENTYLLRDAFLSDAFRLLISRSPTRVRTQDTPTYPDIEIEILLYINDDPLPTLPHPLFNPRWRSSLPLRRRRADVMCDTLRSGRSLFGGGPTGNISVFRPSGNKNRSKGV